MIIIKIDKYVGVINGKKDYFVFGFFYVIRVGYIVLCVVVYVVFD